MLIISYFYMIPHVASLNMYFLFFIIFCEPCFLPRFSVRMYLRCSNIYITLLLSFLQDCSDWFLDSALGRWLTTRKSVLSNLTLLKFLLWLVLLGLFVELEFGLPFFVISLFYWLYEGLRSPAARQPGELSAYSVFNPDCQPLLGSLTAEQLEGEMGYRPLANR